MPERSRRHFVKRTGAGLALAGAPGLVLPARAQNHEKTATLDEYAAALKGLADLDEPAKWEATPPTSDEKFYSRGAPFRAKVSPPGAVGMPLLIGGRVWGLNNRAPLRNSVMEIWHASPDGQHDNQDPKRPPTKGVFLYRARLLTDDSGYYEFETLKPGAYQTSAGTWRASHINLRVLYPGYRGVVTGIYFKGDPHHDHDLLVRPPLVIELKPRKAGNITFNVGRFDIVLEPNA